MKEVYHRTLVYINFPTERVLVVQLSDLVRILSHHKNSTLEVRIVNFYVFLGFYIDNAGFSFNIKFK